MGLKDLKTNLKSLKYGKDTLGGGNSREPYVTTSIDTQPGNTGGPDFTLRANTLQHTFRDGVRLSKFFSSSKGLQFTAKQNLLSRVGVKTQASGIINEGTYLPTSTLLQAAGNPLGTHLLKQGANPSRNTTPSANSTTDLFNSLTGISTPLGLPVYAKAVTTDQQSNVNRLVNLKNSKISTNEPSVISNLFGGSTIGSILSQINPFKNKLGNVVKTIFTNTTSKLGISNFDGEILRYGGGPGSALGVGQTQIKRYYTSVTDGFSNSIDKGYFNVLSSGKGIEGRFIGKDGSTTVTDFRSELPLDTNPNSRQNIISSSPNYSTQNIEKRVNLGNPGKRNKNVSSYTKGLGESLDKINSSPLYKSTEVTNSPTKNDLVKFRIGVIQNNNPKEKVYIHFRAFIDGFSDNYSAEWNSEKYMGRGESFYRYSGFDRNINIDWTVAAQSKEELIPQYQKLNYLTSVLAPDYTSKGYMAGNLVTLTIGGWCYEQPGFIRSINLGVPQESPWEIAINDGGSSDSSVKELPHIVKVSGFNFTPIHNFAPKVQSNEFFNDGVLNKYGNERFIALLSNGKNSNYEDSNQFSIINQITNVTTNPPFDLSTPLTIPSSLGLNKG